MHCLHGAPVVLALVFGLDCASAQGTACTTDRGGRMVCPPPDSTCLVDRYGEVVCSTPGGGIEFDRYGDPACGPGYCTRDLRGELWCSSEPRGASAMDRYGTANCSVACVPAAREVCVKPVPAR